MLHTPQYGTATLCAQCPHSSAPHCRHASARRSPVFLGRKRCPHDEHTRVGRGDGQSKRTRFIVVYMHRQND